MEERMNMNDFVEAMDALKHWVESNEEALGTWSDAEICDKIGVKTPEWAASGALRTAMGRFEEAHDEFNNSIRYAMEMLRAMQDYYEVMEKRFGAKFTDELPMLPFRIELDLEKRAWRLISQGNGLTVIDGGNGNED